MNRNQAGVVYTLCGRGLRYRGNPRKEEMTEVRGTECMNRLDSLRAFQAQELASQERMRIFRNIPRKPSLDHSSSDKPSVEESDSAFLPCCFLSAKRDPQQFLLFHPR